MVIPGRPRDAFSADPESVWPHQQNQYGQRIHMHVGLLATQGYQYGQSIHMHVVLLAIGAVAGVGPPESWVERI